MSMLSTTAKTMSSREIAELTGKRHDHVMRDISRMLLELYPAGDPSFGGTYISEQNKELPMYNLDRKHTDCLLTGYSARARMNVIDRWHELESQQPAVPAWIANLSPQASAAIEDLNNQLEAAKPAVEFVNKYVECSGNKGFREVAKLLKIKENKFRSFLSDQKIMYRLGGT